MEGRVNTLMAGVRPSRSRYRYTAAGSKKIAEEKMYIAPVPAGSRQDELRDYNRSGYRSERPWHETPQPLFEQPAYAAEREAPTYAAQSATGRRKKKKSFAEYLLYHAAREKKDVAACVLLVCAILTMAAMWGQKMVAGVETQQIIASYQNQTIAFEKENERLAQKLEQAKSGERIRNLAQNELNMLRPERAMTETIYIQNTEKTVQESLQQNEEPRMEMLDILLGLLNVFHIGE